MPRSPIPNPAASTSGSQYEIAPLGTTIRTTIERGDAYLSPQLYNVEVSLLELVRGNEAEQRVKSEGISDKSADAGFEYILARIKLGYFRRARGLEDEQYAITEGQIAAASSDGKTEYRIPSLLRQPQPQLVDVLLNPGDVREGWVLLQVAENDKKPLLIYKRKHIEGAYGIWGGIWFQLYQSTEANQK